MQIRPAKLATDAEHIWMILEPIIRSGETYTFPIQMERDAVLRDWFGPGHDVFVATQDGKVLGTYYLRANQTGGGCHVANCGYATAPAAQGQGVASAMCSHSLEHARSRGYLAMQFNFVVSTNTRAIKLWQRFGFAIVGVLPGAFRHPKQGFVDVLVMYRSLT